MWAVALALPGMLDFQPRSLLIIHPHIYLKHPGNVPGQFFPLLEHFFSSLYPSSMAYTFHIWCINRNLGWSLGKRKFAHFNYRFHWSAAHLQHWHLFQTDKFDYFSLHPLFRVHRFFCFILLSMAEVTSYSKLFLAHSHPCDLFLVLHYLFPQALKCTLYRYRTREHLQLLTSLWRGHQCWELRRIGKLPAFAASKSIHS